MTYVKTYLPTLKTHVVNLKRDAKDLSRDLQRLEVRGNGSKTPYYEVSRQRCFPRKVPNDEQRGKTVLFAGYRLFHVCSNTWIRSLFKSHTTILPSLRIAVEYGFFNSPLPLPSLPNFVTNFPLSSNT